MLWGLIVGPYAGRVAARRPVARRGQRSTPWELALIAAVYIGFAVADGRPRVIAIECAVAGLFVLLAATAVAGTAWLLVLGYTGHGLKDAWQRRRSRRDARWWPPFSPPSTGSSPPS